MLVMDKERTTVLLEWSNMQMKISNLFKDLMKENNDYRQNSENLTRQLEKVSSEVELLKNEAKNLKKQKEALKKNNEELISIIDKGIKVLSTLSLSNVNCSSEHKFTLDSLKKIFLEVSNRLEHFKANESSDKTNFEVEEEINCIRHTDLEVEKEIELLNDLNFSTNFYFNNYDEKSPKKNSVIGKSSSNTALKNLFKSTFEVIKTLKGPSSNSENETCESDIVNTIVNAKIFRPVPSSSEEESNLNKSPVFKDLSIRKHDNLSNEENNLKSSTSYEPINEKFLNKSSCFILSPWKKSPQRIEKSPSTPKRVKKKLIINSPDRSPLSFLKKSNNREAEVSFLGVKKLRQTVLNVDCYKRKNSRTNRENENENGNENKNEYKKPSADLDDDDFINESPKKIDSVLEDVKNRKAEHELNGMSTTTPSQTLDLDETYVSSSIIRKSNMPKKRELEILDQNSKPFKRPAREKSPEYDSVPFVYKREPIRKKAERKKLPGHACAECNKYYENVFEDINSQDLKKILNKCSRHRDKNSPALDDTPPGYWKPYLTCTTLISPNKDDASNDG